MTIAREIIDACTARFDASVIQSASPRRITQLASRKAYDPADRWTYLDRHRSLLKAADPCSDFHMQDTAHKYHRRSRRITLSQPVRLSPSSARGELFEEITKTTNVLREGFYFLTRRDHHQEGMRLLVTLPYHCPRDRNDREYLAQVVRIELLDDKQRGVAMQLLSSVGCPQ